MKEFCKVMFTVNLAILAASVFDYVLQLIVLLTFLLIWVLTSLSTLYRSYHDGQFYGQRKPVLTVDYGFVL